MLGNLTKNHQKIEIKKANVGQVKQSTLDDLYFQFNIQKTKGAIKPTKSIIIDNITNIIKEDELAIKVEFSLLPSKASFSKINLDLYFHEQLLNSTPLSIPQSPLLNDRLEYPQIVDMKGMGAGEYLFRIEMYEPWSSNEKLSFSTKEIIVQYVPQSRQSRLVKIPTVKSVAGTDLTVVSSNAKNIYHEIEQNLKKESISKRDEW